MSVARLPGPGPPESPGNLSWPNHGSIFLDEIGDLPIEMQPKLLRVLEEKVFERVGGNTVIQSDFRIIAATNQNLEQLIEQGRFRRDLYYRLNVISLNIPPLRGRSEDIAPLVRHLLRHSSEKHQLRETGISPAAMDSLMAHDWPGNVRELSNVLDRALATMKGETIEPGDLPFGDRSTQNVSSGSTGTPTIQRVQANAEKSAHPCSAGTDREQQIQSRRPVGYSPHAAVQKNQETRDCSGRKPDICPKLTPEQKRWVYPV